MSAGLLDSASNLLAGLLDLGRTRFELFGTELREELARLAAEHGGGEACERLAATVLGGLAALMLAGIGLAFGAAAFILTVSDAYRVAATIGVACSFLLAAALVAWQVRRMTAAKPRAFEATIAELQRDLQTIKP